jgi:hypothetical protein
VGPEGCWWLETRGGGMVVARDVCPWLGMGCCWVETRGWGPKTGLGGSEQVLVSREGVLMGLNAVLGVERGVQVGVVGL